MGEGVLDEGEGGGSGLGPHCGLGSHMRHRLERAVDGEVCAIELLVELTEVLACAVGKLGGGGASGWSAGLGGVGLSRVGMDAV